MSPSTFVTLYLSESTSAVNLTIGIIIIRGNLDDEDDEGSICCWWLFAGLTDSSAGSGIHMLDLKRIKGPPYTKPLRKACSEFRELSMNFPLLAVGLSMGKLQC